MNILTTIFYRLIGKNINLEVTYIILVNKFIQTSLAVKVCGIYISFFILMLTRTKLILLNCLALKQFSIGLLVK